MLINHIIADGAFLDFSIISLGDRKSCLYYFNIAWVIVLRWIGLLF